MPAHNLAEQAAGLASRVNELALLTGGAESQKLMGQRDRLAQLTMTVITSELDEEKAEYQSASNLLMQAIAQAGLAENRGADIAVVIEQVTKAIAALEKALA